MSTYKKICITNRKLLMQSHLEQVERSNTTEKTVTRGAFPDIWPDLYCAHIEKLCAADIDLFILREKDLDEEIYEKLARRVIAICREHEKTVMLHTFIEAARRLDYPYIHLNMADYLALKAEDRRWFQKIGVSTHTVEEAVLCQQMGASYVTASHIFATDCKPGLQPRGLDYLRETVRAVHTLQQEKLCAGYGKDTCPEDAYHSENASDVMAVYALGGIHPENAADCIAAGADGVCMMSEYMRC